MTKPLIKSNKDKRWTVRPKALPVPYSLLLKLKKAGFPQDEEGRTYNDVFVPTCDDVIKYLGERFGNLGRYKFPSGIGRKDWLATEQYDSKKLGKVEKGEGKTPLEALIRLYITTKV